MSRVIAIVACGFTLTACTSTWMPSFDMSSLTPNLGGSAQQTVTLAVESDPPGAEARSTAGPATCRTPCQLAVTPTEPFTVSIALNGYQPQTVPVQIARPEDPRISSEEGAPPIRLDPNPVFVELVRVPAPPPVVKKKPAPRHRTPTAARPAPTTAAAPAPVAAPPQFEPAPATAAAPPPPAPAPAATAAAPWPMPR